MEEAFVLQWTDRLMMMKGLLCTRVRLITRAGLGSSQAGLNKLSFAYNSLDRKVSQCCSAVHLAIASSFMPVGQW